jgi:hypothetical protein
MAVTGMPGESGEPEDGRQISKPRDRMLGPDGAAGDFRLLRGRWKRADQVVVSSCQMRDAIGIGRQRGPSRRHSEQLFSHGGTGILMERRAIGLKKGRYRHGEQGEPRRSRRKSTIRHHERVTFGTARRRDELRGLSGSPHAPC